MTENHPRPLLTAVAFSTDCLMLQMVARLRNNYEELAHAQMSSGKTQTTLTFVRMCRTILKSYHVAVMESRTTLCV
jgi:hypothetical protein